MFHLRIFTLAIFCAAILLHSPAFTQTNEFSSSNKISYGPSSAPPLLIQNDIVAVQVRTANDTLGNGEIHYTGLFNIGTADNLPLLFEFPDNPVSSHVNVSVDGLVYSNDPFRTGARVLTLVSTPVVRDSTIVCVYAAGPIEVEQRLTPKKFSRTTGGILIEYQLINRDGLNPHQAGVLLELDTFINGNDAASVLTSFGYSRNEQQFDAPAIPDFFQAFQGNLVAPGLVAQGTLIGFNAVRPDRMVIGDWTNLRGVQWNYVVPNNQPYGDSAVLLRWNEKNLTPNESRTVATYYGKGDVTTQAGQLTLHMTAPRNLQASNGQLTPNPFDVNLLVYNNSGTPANAVQATLRLPVGLALVSGELATKLLAPSSLNAGLSGTASWKVLAQCPLADIDLNMIVDVSASPNLSNSVTRAIFLPSCSATLPNFTIKAQPDDTTITAGETASFQVNMTALNGFSEAVQLSYYPPNAGVSGTFSPATLPPNGASQFDLQTNRNLVAGEYRFIITGTGGGLTRSDSITVHVNAAAPLDTIPPLLANPFPANGATSVPLNTKISVEVSDPAPGMGVDRNSIRMFVNGALVRADTTRRGAGYVVEYSPARPFNLNELIAVKVFAHDLALPPNGDSLSFSFRTIQDIDPPFLTNQNPTEGQKNVSLLSAVSCDVVDNLSGIDSTSIVMGVRGSLVPVILTRIPKGFHVYYKPPQPFRETETVRIAVGARDLSQQRNLLSRTYFFTTTRDSLPPVVSELAPGPNTTNLSTNFEITARLRDDLTGVDSAAVHVFINGLMVVPTLRREGKDFLLAAKPATTPQLNDTIAVKLLFADLAARRNRDSLEYTIFIAQDKAPPFVIAQNPAKEARGVPLQTSIIAKVRDEIAGVDSSALRMFVNAQLVAPNTIREGNDFRLEYGPVTFRDGERVEVEIHAQDLATPPNAMPVEKYSFTTVRDSLAPVVLDLQPSRNAANVALDAEIRARLRDDLAGVDSAAVRLFINGREEAPRLTRAGRDFLLNFKPSAGFSYNEVVNVRLIAADLARVPNMDTTVFSFAIIQDREPPFVTAHSPARNASNVSPKTPITFDVRDAVAGVDSATIKLRLNGEAVARVLRGNLAAYSVAFTPDPEALLRAGDTVYVEIEAADLVRPANSMQKDSYYYILSRDRTAPFTAGHNPPRNSRNVSLESEIALEIRDVDPGVDSAAIRVTVNGNAVALQYERVEDGYRVRYVPPSRLRDNHTFNVQVEAQDLAAPPNVMPRAEYSFTTVRDSLAPVARDFSPRPEESKISSLAEIRFTIEDDLTGVDSSSFALQVNGNAVQPVLQRTSKGFAVRYDLAAQALSRDTVRVAGHVQDLASQPNAASFAYYFVISQDRTPPYVTGLNPAPNARNVGNAATISATVVDEQSGVDIQTVRLEVDGQVVQPEISVRGRAATLLYKPALPWPYHANVSVLVRAQDLAAPPNRMEAQAYSFTVVADTIPPAITDFFPSDNAGGVATTTTISFQIHDEQAGVDSAALNVFVNGVRRTVALSGSPRVYRVSYKPSPDFSAGQRVEVIVQARDLATPPNVMPQRSFHFTTAEPLPDLLAVELRSQGEFQLGKDVKVKGIVRREGFVRENYLVSFSADGQTLKDTTITPGALGATFETEASVRFESGGAHFLEMMVDGEDKIKEVNESNNRVQLPVQITETLATKLTVRPNPFTPNDDGFNDEVEFNFTGLTLENPTLHIFDVNGVSIYLTDRHNGKRFTWNGEDEGGNAVPPGVYLYTLRDRGNNVRSGYVVVAR